VSLAARLTAFAQAVGADIKDLKARTAIPASAARSTAPGASVSLAAGWNQLPLPTALTIEPSDAFVFAGNSVTVKDAGWYDVSASVLSTAGGTPTIFVALSTVNAGTDGDIANSGTATQFSRVNASGSVKLAAGAKVYLWAYSAVAAVNAYCVNFTIARIGGPQGPAGAAGAPGGTMGAASAIGIGTPVNHPGAPNFWKLLPFAADIAISSTDGTPDFTRNANGTLTFNKAGTYDISCTAGDFNNPHPSAATVDVRLLIAPVGVTPDPNTGSMNYVAVERTTAPNAEYTIMSMAGKAAVVAGQTLACYMYSALALTGVGVSQVGVSRSGGPKGDPGIPGGTIGAFNKSVKPTTDWAIPAATTTVPGLSVTVPTTGEYLVFFAADLNLAPANGYIIAWPAVNGVIPTNIEAAVKQTYSVAFSERFPFNKDWLISANAGDIITIQMNNSGHVSNNIGSAHTTLVVSRAGGPKGDKGDKGDTGGIDSYTTLNWNTAVIPGFYRSTNDLLGPKTINGPGDTLNPPAQAGIVAVHQGGLLVQRVWDLETQQGWTRYGSTGGGWTAWAAELTKPPVFTDLSAGGLPPQDGDERYFQNAAMKAAGILWRFRYDAAAPAGKPKWVFAGGQGWYDMHDGDTFAPVANVWADSGAPGPGFTIPLQGDYSVEFGGLIYSNAIGVYAGMDISVGGTLTGRSVLHGNFHAAYTDYHDASRTSRVDNCPQGSLMKLVYYSNPIGGGFQRRYIKITPIRVVM
jgi:hypothetical protein